MEAIEPSELEILVIDIQWQEAINIFREEYSSIYRISNNTRLYFSDKQRVDGATQPWMLISMIDGMLCTLIPNLANSSSKRIFDQTKVVQSAVKQVIAKGMEGKDRTNKFITLHIECANTEANNWESYETLKASILSARVSRKAVVKQKLVAVTDYVFNSLMEKGNLQTVVQEFTKLMYLSLIKD